MGRTSYAAMSLVAAVPAAFLVLLLVMGFLQHADQMSGLLPAVVGLTLIVAALVAATPVGILLFGGAKSGRSGRSTKAAVAASSSVAEAEPAGSLEVEEVESGEFESADDLSSDWTESEEFEADTDFGDADSDQFEFDDDLSAEFDADLDFDDDAKR